MKKKSSDIVEQLTHVDSPAPSFFVHERGMCETTIGNGSRVWAHAHVMKGAVIGTDCNIGEGSFVESGAIVGDGCTIKNGVSIWDGVTLDGDVFVGPNAVFTNDMVPRTKSVNPEFHLVRTTIGRGSSIGANATIVCGTTLGEYCMVGAGAVVTKNVPAFALVYGTPARIKGWVSKKGAKLSFSKKGIAVDNDGNIYKQGKKNTVELLSGDEKKRAKEKMDAKQKANTIDSTPTKPKRRTAVKPTIGKTQTKHVKSSAKKSVPKKSTKSSATLA